MAVYTEVSDEELSAFLAGYDVGALLSYKGIAEGVENTNYLVHAESGPYILTLYEKRVEREELPFFLGLMEHLAAAGITCPTPVRDLQGRMLRDLAGRPAAVITFLEGLWIRRPTARHCAAIGRSLAEMHLAGRDFHLTRKNRLSVSSWRPLYRSFGRQADSIRPDLSDLIQDELSTLEQAWPQGLPAGVIHADLFPDNVFFLGDAVSGLIDFYFACNDMLAYDIGICLNAWCFEPDNSFNITKARALLNDYARTRPLSAEEFETLPILARGAALRFLLTRVYDWLNTPESALVRPKDPIEYLRKLRFHRGVASAREYGLGDNLTAAAVSKLKSPTETDLKTATVAEVEIYTDGACSGNPGPGGWGAVLISGKHRKEIKGGKAETTNNQMELMAAIRALEGLKRPRRVALHTDSSYLRNGITQWIKRWKRNGWRTADKKPVKNVDLWQRLDAARQEHDVRWHWVKGHAGHPENERADELARVGMEPFAGSLDDQSE